jgi:hypothetical protein
MACELETAHDDVPNKEPVNEVATILPDINVDPDTIRPLRAINSLAIYFFLSFSRMV